MKILTFVIAILFKGVLMAALPPDIKKIAETPYLKVRIGKNLTQVEISGVDLKRTFLVEKETKFFRGRKKINFKCEGLGLQKKIPDFLLASLGSSTGLITFNKNKYLGDLYIATSAGGKNCDVINEIPMEVYIGGLLSNEMNSSWHSEALKAQAVAARTYAFHKLYSAKEKDFFHIENSERHQVSGSFFDVTNQTLNAAQATRGEILVASDGSIRPTFFHASCGGSTLLPDQVWGNKVTGYKRTECLHCQKRMVWDNHLSPFDINSFFKWLAKKNIVQQDHLHKKFQMVNDKFNDPFFRFYLGSNQYKIKKSFFRRFFGRFKFSSNNFKISKSNDQSLIIQGRGQGHGVGLCQIGTKRYAEAGNTYREILSHYFPGFRLEKLY